MEKVSKVVEEIQKFIDTALAEENLTFQEVISHFKRCPLCRARVIKCPFCGERTPIDFKCHNCKETLPLETILKQLAKDLTE